MKKINFFLLYAKTYFGRNKRKNVLILLGVVISILVLIKLGSSFLTNTVSEGMIGVYTKDNLPPPVTDLLSEPLVKLDRSGQPVPGLASGWQTNSEATLYTFKLRDNLFWSDGSRVRSKDIKVNLPDVDVSYPDDQTIVFKLADSFSPFPTLLTAPVLKSGTLVGLGKYKVTDLILANGLVTKITLGSVDQSLPKVIVRFYPDERTAKTAFDRGEVQGLIGASSIDDYSNQRSVQMKKLPSQAKITAIFYNTKDPILSDKNFRLALGYSTPDVTGEDQANSPIPPNSWAYDSNSSSHRSDPAQASAYFDKVKNGQNSTITLTTVESLKSVGEKIVEGWKKTGINAVLRVESGVPQNFQALLISENIPADPDQYSLWHSTQTQTNISQLSSPRIDRDLEDGRKSADQSKRKERYDDFQRILLDDAPATFLYFPKINAVYLKKAGDNLTTILKLQYPQS